MLLTGKTAVIFGGSGAVGSAVAHAVANEGAHVHLGARGQTKLDQVAAAIRATGGKADTFQVDALDGEAISDAMARLANQTGGIDIVVNATGFLHHQGKEIDTVSLTEFLGAITPFLSAQFNIAKAVAPHMGDDRGGAIITVVAPAARLAMPGHLGHITACAGTEAFSKALAAELGPRNIRVLSLRSHAIADAIEAGSHTREIFGPKAEAMAITVQDWLIGAAQGTMLKRLPTLQQVAATIAFLASGHAAAMTGSVVNMTAGFTTD